MANYKFVSNTRDTPLPSTRVRSATQATHEVVFYADALLNGVAIRPELPIVGGSISANRNNLVRRTGTVLIGDRSLIPRRKGDPLAPYGQELRVRYGVRLPDGSEEMTQIFLGGIQDASWDESVGAVRVNVADRMQRVLDAKTYQPRSIRDQFGYTNVDAAGTIHAIDAISTVFMHALLPIPFAFDAPVYFDTSFDRHLRTPPRLFVEDDPWTQVCAPLIKNWGAEAYAGVDGRLHVVPVPDVRKLAPLMTVKPGPGQAMTSATAGLSRVGTANAVTVFSAQLNSADPPYWHTAVDDNPSSPTYFASALDINGRPSTAGIPAGQFGRVSLQLRSETARTREECKREAEATLRDRLGVIHSVTVNSLVAGWLTPGQVIQLEMAGVNSARHLIDSMEIPLSHSETMSITTRSYAAPLK